MSRRTIVLHDGLYDYYRAHAVRDEPVLEALRDETAKLPQAGFQISAEQGQFMRFLVAAIGAKRCLEVGTFTGYSALCVALALPADGELICCDQSEEWTSIGQPFWERAGVAAKITLRLGPGAETLQALLDEGRAGSFDFFFVDADKPGYDAYYELGLHLLRPGGLIGFDNAFMGGRVADPEATGHGVEAMRALNAKVLHDPRVEPAFVPIGDGLLLARKLP